MAASVQQRCCCEMFAVPDKDAKGREDEPTEQLFEVEASSVDYDEADMPRVGVSVAAASVTYALKGEDRHAVLRFADDPRFEDCQKRDDHAPYLIAYAALFDGHDGPSCSEYCAKGMLCHILAEISDIHHRTSHRDRNPSSKLIETVSGDMVSTPLQAGFINAFHQAQTRFANDLDPPSFREVKQGPAATRSRLNRLRQLLRPGKRESKRGGTTACVLSILAKKNGKVLPEAIVANTGDSRVLTDDGLDTASFRQITRDHRPSEPSEKARLQECARRGEGTVERSGSDKALRVFPGGLAVSRTIGDVAHSKAVICTPDVFHVPLNMSAKRAQRFVIASDGLWDVLPNQKVGELAARFQKRSESERPASKRSPSISTNISCAVRPPALDEPTVFVPPSAAASKILEHCLHNGGFLDDVTILVVDVRQC